MRTFPHPPAPVYAAMLRLSLPAALLLAALAACTGTPTPDDAEDETVTTAWRLQRSGTSARLQAVSPVDGAVVWASGTAGTFARTTDGGETWTTGVVPGADTLEFRDVHGISAETAYLLSAGSGAASRIYRTDDGGETWTLQFVNDAPEGFFDCLAFWDADRGLAFSDAVDGDFLLVRTTDGGETWMRVPPEALPDARPGEGAFAASGTCLVAQPGGRAWFGTGASGRDTRVYRTTDYGATWTAAPTPIASASPSSGIFTLAFRDSLHGVALGGEYARPDTLLPNAALTTDGGRTWNTSATCPLPGAVFGAAFVPGTTTLLAVAPTGTARSDDGGHTWAVVDTASYWSVAAVQGAAWAVGPEGRIGWMRIE